jgi:hypothetical protein
LLPLLCTKLGNITKTTKVTITRNNKQRLKLFSTAPFVNLSSCLKRNLLKVIEMSSSCPLMEALLQISAI